MESIFNTSLRETDYSTPAYRLVLSYDETHDADGNEIQAQKRYAEIDFQEGDVKVNSTVSVSDHPTMNGFNISDHIYREPISINITGSFAENGSKAMSWTGSDRLTSIQTEFEKLQRAGTKFTVSIMKGFDTDNASNQRYISRKCMALEDISWDEGQDILSFAFKFKEAISTTATAVEAATDVTDPNLPEITDLVASSLVGDVISTDEFVEMLIEILQKKGLTDAQFFKYCGAIALGELAGIGAIVTVALLAAIKIAISAAISAAVAGASATAAAAAGGAAIVGVASAVPVGTVIAIAAVLCAAIGAAIGAAVHIGKINRYIEKGIYFKIKDDMTEEEKNEVAERFVTFISSCKQSVDNNLTNVSVYEFVNSDRQECCLSLNGNYYSLIIEKNNIDGAYYMTVKCNEEDYKASTKVVGLSSFAEMTDSSTKMLFRDKDDKKYRVYLLDKYAATEQEDARTNSMSDYILIATDRNCSTLQDDITAIIKDCIEE